MKNENMIIINIVPFELTDRESKNENWIFKKLTATQNLDVAKQTIFRRLTNDIPIKFHNEINLKLSVNKSTLKTKVDYSGIHDKQSKRLAKSYLSGDQATFAKEC